MIALRPLSVLYGAVISAKNALYDAHVLHPRRLRWPVVSVGNINAGGSGKTPFVIALIEEFKKRGIACDVLSRGYGRKTSGVLVVDTKGTADDFGDEPLLIARRTGVPVVVGQSRYAAGVKAETLRPSEERIHILDDGFQHRKLARDFDIVLLGADDLSDSLLPCGRLRESLSNMKRADAIAIQQDTARIPGGVPQWHYRREIEVPHGLSSPIAFCGIARPQRFFDDIKRKGISTVFDASFRDHYRYIGVDVKKLLAWREQYGADGFLTTEKDLVRLGHLAQALEPIVAVRLHIRLDDADRTIRSILAQITSGRDRRLSALP